MTEKNKKILILGIVLLIVFALIFVVLLRFNRSIDTSKQANLNDISKVRELIEKIDMYYYKVGDYYNNGLTVYKVSGKAVYFAGNLKITGTFENREEDPKMAYSFKGTYLITNEKIAPFDVNEFYVDDDNAKKLGLDSGSGKIEATIKEFVLPIEGPYHVMLSGVKKIIQN